MNVLTEQPNHERAIRINHGIIRVVTVIGFLLSLWLGYQIHQKGIFATSGNFQHHLAKGTYPPAIFVLIQVAQVIYPIIPGGLTCVIGQLVYGSKLAFLYNFTGITIGSIINFYLARHYGEWLVRAFVSEKMYQKSLKWINQGKRFDWFLAIAFALPGFPDDFLCMVAGMTKMTFKRFLVIYMITKPATLYLYTIVATYGVGYFFHYLHQVLP